MTDKRSYFEQAGDALKEAFAAPNLTEQGRLLEQALRLHQLAIQEERAKLQAWASGPKAP